MDVLETAIPEVKLVTPIRHRDDRGFLSEVYHEDALAKAGIDARFVQENHVYSSRPGTVRGLHFQLPPQPAAKLVRTVRGAVLDVAVDLRRGSPTYGDHITARLDAENWSQLWIPEGFAHGMCSLEPDTEVVYKTTAYWSPDLDAGILWNDPDLGVRWPVSQDSAIVSPKDAIQQGFVEFDSPFVYEASR